MKLNFIISKIENNQAVLKDGSGRLINWPADLLPPNAKTSDKIDFNIGDEENQVKNILNEILNQG